MNYANLISRLESATGPSRELDAEIALANGWTYEKKKDERGRGGDRKPYWRKPGVTEWYTHEKDGPPRYTESIDAALTLMPVLKRPEGALWMKLMQFAGAHGSHASAFNAEIWGIKDDKEVKWYGIHESPATALVIACLKAREG